MIHEAQLKLKINLHCQGIIILYKLYKLISDQPPTSSPPGRLTADNMSAESSLDLVSTFQRLCPTSNTRPTTTSPISPLYLGRRTTSNIVERSIITLSSQVNKVKVGKYTNIYICTTQHIYIWALKQNYSIVKL